MVALFPVKSWPPVVSTNSRLMGNKASINHVLGVIRCTRVNRPHGTSSWTGSRVERDSCSPESLARSFRGFPGRFVPPEPCGAQRSRNRRGVVVCPSGCEDGLLGDELGGHVATNDLGPTKEREGRMGDSTEEGTGNECTGCAGKELRDTNEESCLDEIKIVLKVYLECLVIPTSE